MQFFLRLRLSGISWKKVLLEVTFLTFSLVLFKNHQEIPICPSLIFELMSDIDQGLYKNRVNNFWNSRPFYCVNQYFQSSQDKRAVIFKKNLSFCTLFIINTPNKGIFIFPILFLEFLNFCLPLLTFQYVIFSFTVFLR